MLVRPSIKPTRTRSANALLLLLPINPNTIIYLALHIINDQEKKYSLLIIEYQRSIDDTFGCALVIDDSVHEFTSLAAGLENTCGLKFELPTHAVDFLALHLMFHRTHV